MLETKHFYEFGPFRLDPTERLLLRNNQPVPLAPKAFETLVLLVENSGHLLTKEELMKRLWPETFVEEVNLAQNISAVRRALDDKTGGAQYIETVPKGGYRFVGPVSVSQPTVPASTFARVAIATPSPPMHPGKSNSFRRRVALGVGVVVVLAVLAWGIGRSRVRAGDSHSPIRSIAILPLQN